MDGCTSGFSSFLLFATCSVTAGASSASLGFSISVSTFVVDSEAATLTSADSFSSATWIVDEVPCLAAATSFFAFSTSSLALADANRFCQVIHAEYRHASCVMRHTDYRHPALQN